MLALSSQLRETADTTQESQGAIISPNQAEGKGDTIYWMTFTPHEFYLNHSLANYKSSLWVVFGNKVLLAHSHAPW